MVGILVHGNNHFILSGPRPDEKSARALACHFSLIQIGVPKSLVFDRWQIREKEFRENLQWAFIVPGDRETSPGVVELLAELSARGVFIETGTRHGWTSTHHSRKNQLSGDYNEEGGAKDRKVTKP